MPTNKPFVPHQKKSLSQIFLQDSSPCVFIAEELAKRQVTRVLEVGPGKGILTTELLKQGFEVLAIEKDERWVDWLNTHIPHERLTITNADFLQFDLDPWLSDKTPPSAIVGNIPYHISTAILEKTFRAIRQNIPAWFLVQLEYAQRLAAEPNCKSYGSLSIYTQLQAQTEIILKVPKTSFKPVPKVDSAVVRLIPQEQQLSEETLKSVEVFTKHSFSQRRKKLRNSLKPFFTNQNLNLDDSPIDLDRRCDQLSPEEFITISKHLRPKAFD